MSTRFLVVPQWQGSASSRAMRLIDGAEAIRGDLPSSSTTLIEIPLGAGEALDTGVARFSSLAIVRERLAMELDAMSDTDLAVTIGGDCGVELSAVERAARVSAAAGEKIAVVWFDAHPDLLSPRESTSHAFCGMVLRTVLGDGPEGLVGGSDLNLDSGSVVLAGTRSIEAEEAEFIAVNGIPLLEVDQLNDPQRLVETIAATGATSVYLHIDLDVLDPAEIDGLADPQPFGLQLAELVALIRACTANFRLAGAGIAMFAPHSVEAAVQDLPPILRLLSALTRAAA